MHGKTMNTVLCMAMGCAAALLAPLGAWAAETNQNPEAKALEAIAHIRADVGNLKAQFPELAHFRTNAVPLPQEALAVKYSWEVDYVPETTGMPAHYSAKTNGCILTVQLFPDGSSWPTMPPNGTTINVLCQATGVRAQAFIDAPNTNLVNSLREVVEEAIAILE